MTKFDFVYTFHFREEDKNEALIRLNKSISSLNLNQVNVCLMNCSKYCIREFIPFNIKYEYVPTDFGINLYNRAFMVNESVKRMVTSEYFNLSDIDILYPKTFLRTMKDIINQSNERTRIVFHNHNMGNGNFNTYEDCKKEYDSCKDNLRSKTGPAIGLGIIHTETFKRINGFDERFLGYGPEDKEFNFRISRVCKYIDLDDAKVNTYHLWHMNNTPRINYRNNMRIWYYIKEHIERNNLVEVKSGSIPIPEIIYHQEGLNIKEIEL